MRLNKSLLIIVAAAVISACAKSPAGVTQSGAMPENRSHKKEKAFVIAVMHHPFGSRFTETFNRKILGVWRDKIDTVSARYSKTPMAICISGPVVRRLASISEDEKMFSPLLVSGPEKLTGEQADYLRDKYNVTVTTFPVGSLQVLEGLGYLGTSLKKSDYIRGLLEKSTFTLTDKDELTGFMREEAGNFNGLLKTLLDTENIEEAVTSLSDAHMGLLDRERIKVQILESMVNYKMFKGNFPDGFVPRSGYLNADSIEQLTKTSLKWFTSNSTGTAEYTRTNPQALYIDDFFCSSASSSAVCGYLRDVPNESGRPRVLVVGIEDIEMILEDKYLELIGFDEFIETVFEDISEEETVPDISTAAFSCRPGVFSAGLDTVAVMLKEAREIAYKYKNSGRASLDVLMDIQNNLLIAEAGEICENFTVPEYERVFRKSLIEVYRKIELSPPIRLFMPVMENKSVVPETEMTSIVSVECDGKTEPGEWEGSLVSTSTGRLINEIFCGFGNEKVYYMLNISSGDVDTAGVYIGHMNASGAALFPRGHKTSVDEVQDFPVYLDVNWRKKVPGKTVIYRTTGNESWEALTGSYEVGYSTGILEFSVPLKYIGISPRKKLFFRVYAEDSFFPEDGHFSVTVPDFKMSRSKISYIDPVGDTYGPGNYVVPSMMEDYEGCLDIRKIEADENNGEKVIALEFSSLENPYSAPYGFSLSIIDIYIDVNGRAELGTTQMLDGRKAYTVTEDAWEYCITVSGWNKAVYNSAGKKIGEPEISISPLDNTINIFIKGDIIPASVENWGIIPVVLAADNEGNMVIIKEEGNGDPHAFTGRRIDSDTNIIDTVLPSGYQQKMILGANRKGRAIELPALRKN
ncbi:MAG: glucodextranase DOMON-like domain-containing protein [Elusimicrobiota bacterium]